MPRYQIYVLGVRDEIEDVAAVIACDNDQEAIRKVRLLVDSHEIELWARLADRSSIATCMPCGARSQ